MPNNGSSIAIINRSVSRRFNCTFAICGANLKNLSYQMFLDWTCSINYFSFTLVFQSPTKQVAFADEANITTTARQQSDTQMPPVKKRKIIDVSAGDAQLD